MNWLMYRTARLNLQRCMHLCESEHLAIVHDDTVDPATVEAFAAAALSLDAEVSVLRYLPRTHVSMREFGRFAAASMDAEVARVPDTVIATLAAADAGLLLNSDLAMLFDPRFGETVGRTRIAWLPYLDGDNLLRLLPGSEADVEALYRTTTAAGTAVAAATEVTITDGNGTDLRMRIGAHRVNWSTGVHEEGKGYGGVEIWPGGQISTVPAAGTAQGRLVIDRSVNAPEYKELLDPIGLSVVDGQVASIDGGAEADRLRRYLGSLDDLNAYHLTEFGLGTNALCMAAGLSGPCEDTHTLGALSLALGADVHLGGVTRAPCHVDMTVRAATVSLDGQTIVDGGRLLV